MFRPPYLMPVCRLLPLLGVAAALAGCSRPPGDAEARAALEKLYAGLAGGLVKVESVKVLVCEKAGEAYRCDVTIGAMGQKTTAQMRFVKTADGWVASATR